MAASATHITLQPLPWLGTRGNVHSAAWLQVAVSSVEEAMLLLRRAARARQVAGTCANERSSRGHAVFTVRFLHDKQFLAESGNIVSLAQLMIGCRRMCLLDAFVNHMAGQTVMAQKRVDCLHDTACQRPQRQARYTAYV